MLTLVSAPDHMQAKSGLATQAKFLGPDDVSFWNAGIPIKSVLAQLVTCKSHDILSLAPKSGPGTRLSRKMEAKIYIPRLNLRVPSSALTRHIFETAMDMQLDFTLSEMQVDCIVSSLSGKTSPLTSLCPSLGLRLNDYQAACHMTLYVIRPKEFGPCRQTTFSLRVVWGRD